MEGGLASQSPLALSNPLCIKNVLTVGVLYVKWMPAFPGMNMRDFTVSSAAERKSFLRCFFKGLARLDSPKDGRIFANVPSGLFMKGGACEEQGHR